jgi:isopenicillin N synthase-like dioxygenase
LRRRNQWPAAPSEIRADVMAYFEASGAMCDRMLPPFAVGLGLPGDFFAPFFADEAHAVVRFLHYPPQETTDENTFGLAPHTDNSFMTALARTDGPGLSVRLLSQRMGSGNAARTTVRHGEKPAIVRTGEKPSRLELTGLRCRVLDTVRT